MDDSFASTGSFDEDTFMQNGLQSTQTNIDTSDQMDISMENVRKSTATVDISGLLTGSSSMSSSMIKLDVSLTPKTMRKRSFSRRCLSIDLFSDDKDSLMSSPKQSKTSPQSSMMLPPPFSKRPLSNSSIQNTPERQIRSEDTEIELTPEFCDVQIRRRPRAFGSSEFRKRSLPVPEAKSLGFALKKCYSENQASIIEAVQNSSHDLTLIADCSKSYILPTLNQSKHRDLRSISHSTLADLLSGKFDELISSFKIIDCRFPYEFEGGHIRSAINVYTQEELLKNFISNQENEAQIQGNSAKRDILIFHCEFSSERGPSLYRFLRNSDRAKNAYPRLHYPEVYLLEGGYKDFFIHHKELCEPQVYVPMHSKEFDLEQRKYRHIMKANSFDSKMSVFKRNQRFQK